MNEVIKHTPAIKERSLLSEAGRGNDFWRFVMPLERENTCKQLW